MKIDSEMNINLNLNRERKIGWDDNIRYQTYTNQSKNDHGTDINFRDQDGKEEEEDNENYTGSDNDEDEYDDEDEDDDEEGRFLERLAHLDYTASQQSQEHSLYLPDDTPAWFLPKSPMDKSFRQSIGGVGQKNLGEPASPPRAPTRDILEDPKLEQRASQYHVSQNSGRPGTAEASRRNVRSNGRG